MKKILFIVLYVLMMLCLIFAVCEVAARFKYQRSYLAVNIGKHPIYHHLLKPNTRGSMSSEGDYEGFFISNNRSMRGPGDYVYEKKDGVSRIAVMGDSFTFGVGVEVNDTYPALLSKALNSSHPGKFEVLNFGVSSFSPLLHYIYLKKELIKYQPELLILALDLCDIQDDYFYEKNMVRGSDGEIDRCDPRFYEGHPDWWALAKERSIFLSILNEKLIQSVRKIKVIGFMRYIEMKKNKIRSKTAILLDPHSDNIEFDRFIFMRDIKDDAIVRRHWERSARYLLMIKEFCDEHKIKFVLVAYPYGHLVGPDQWAKGRRYWGFEAGRTYDATRPFALIKKFSDENKINFISLLEPMRQNNDKTLYFNNDGHWTKEGHKVAAQTIRGHIRGQVST